MTMLAVRPCDVNTGEPDDACVICWCPDSDCCCFEQLQLCTEPGTPCLDCGAPMLTLDE